MCTFSLFLSTAVHYKVCDTKKQTEGVKIKEWLEKEWNKSNKDLFSYSSICLMLLQQSQVSFINHSFESLVLVESFTVSTPNTSQRHVILNAE